MKKRPRQPLLRRLLVWVIVILVAWSCILLVKKVAYEPFEVPSASMMPTLRVGDVVLVDKTAYGWSWPWSHTPHTPDLPARGEVVVFVHPKTGEYYVKRVMGLPGEHVMVLGQRVWINGVPLERYDAQPDNGEMTRWPQAWSATTDIRWARTPAGDYRVLWSKDEKSWTLSGYWEVPPNTIFVMGDWRDESSDSRVWGVVPRANLVGRVICLWDGGTRSGLQPIAARTRCDLDAPVP